MNYLVASRLLEDWDTNDEKEFLKIPSFTFTMIQNFSIEE